MTPLTGIHHVTAISGDAQKNLDFYGGVLGLRLVKKTVNFDDPGSYHLYYGDRAGTPGTIVTFFVWPGAGRSKTGVGEPVALTFAVPKGSLDYWRDRLETAGHAPQSRTHCRGADLLSIADPDGMNVELAESTASGQGKYWAWPGVSEEHAVRGISSVSLVHTDLTGSRELFTSGLGFQYLGSDEHRARYRIGHSFVDVIKAREDRHGRMGAGTIHHMAFRVDDDAAQAKWRNHVTGLGLPVSPVMDRNYFRSIYFREPDGVLFEVATDPPGFEIDEPSEALGSTLKLPSWYEPQRSLLEARLPKLVMPEARA